MTAVVESGGGGQQRIYSGGRWTVEGSRYTAVVGGQQPWTAAGGWQHMNDSGEYTATDIQQRLVDGGGWMAKGWTIG